MVQKGIPVREEVDLEEGVEVQITLKGSGPINKRSHVHDFKSKADAEKWIKWYKTGGSLYKKSEIEKILIHETITEGAKIAQLVGKSIAHLGFYEEMIDAILKLPEISFFHKGFERQLSMLKMRARQAKSSVPPLVRDLKKPGIFSEEINEQREAFVNILNETDKDSAYAIGMSVAKKKMNDEPPLEKKTIKKAHDIADKIIAKEAHPSKETYERLIKGK
jgi:hypothetical protein